MTSRPPPGVPPPTRPSPRGPSPRLPPGIPQQPAVGVERGESLQGGTEAASGTMQMPQVRMPVGPPTAWPASPPPPPAHAPPFVQAQTLQGIFSSPELGEHLVNDALLAAVRERVLPMLAAATRASELQVSTEMRKLQSGFAALTTKLGRVQSLLHAHDPPERSVQQVHTTDSLCQALIEVERRWDQEIKDVKRELHQTILAHNHNADVMADHKTAIDKICSDGDEVGHLQFQSDADNQLQEQLQRLAHTLEHTKAQDQEVDTLLQRGEALSQRLGAMGIAHPSAMGAALPSHAYGQGPSFHPTFQHAFA